MILPTKKRAACSAAAACLLAGALVGCAVSAPREQADRPAPLRVMVKLVHSSEDPTEISAEAARVAGVPTSYAAATSPVWHALLLHCASAAECETALARLRAASGVYQTVELDGRKSRSAS